jgi:uncharacterized protein YgbK (DUF1537 family)
MESFLIIADDFTGANDTGVQIRKRGIPVKVLLDPSGIGDDGSSAVLDTESRNIDGRAAYELVRKFAAKISWADGRNVIKKVDSTLRGNIAWELKALDESYGPDYIVFAPAFPEIGRTTSGGVHMIDGRPVCSTEFARDPKKPATEDRLPVILSGAFAEPVQSWDLGRLRSGPHPVPDGRLHCFDAETPDDMRLIVETVLSWNGRTLWVGSAGIAGALLGAKVPPKAALGVVGSVSEKSREQLLYCESKGTTIIKADIAGLLSKKDIAPYVAQCLDAVRKGKDAVLCSAYSRRDYDEAVKAGAGRGMSGDAVGDFTRQILAATAAAVALEAGDCLCGLFLTGGDTAIGLIRETGAYGSTISGEVALGIPMMRIDGGTLAGRRIITKAGAFGDADTLRYCMEKLKED